MHWRRFVSCGGRHLDREAVKWDGSGMRRGIGRAWPTRRDLPVGFGAQLMSLRKMRLLLDSQRRGMGEKWV